MSAEGLLRRRDGEPVFEEAWQAQMMALVNGLIERGSLSAATFSEALGAELKARASAGAPDTSATYYGAALKVLEELSLAGGLVAAGEIDWMRAAWRQAYEATPHGKPVPAPPYP